MFEFRMNDYISKPIIIWFRENTAQGMGENE
jgi:hypothetical protein